MTKKLLWGIVVAYVAVLGLLVQIRLDKNTAQTRLGNGFVFPLATTKADIAQGSEFKGQTLTWSTDADQSYHHDYTAADIHVPEGTHVVAAKGGKVVTVRNVDTCTGRNFPIVIVQGVDNLYYLYSHLKPGSIQVVFGGQVGTGEPLAEVGSADCAQGSAPHLHFDVSRFPFAIRGGFGGEVTLIDPQPALIKAYQELPKK